MPAHIPHAIVTLLLPVVYILIYIGEFRYHFFNTETFSAVEPFNIES